VISAEFWRANVTAEGLGDFCSKTLKTKRDASQRGDSGDPSPPYKEWTIQRQTPVSSVKIHYCPVSCPKANSKLGS
jgi:hypothetical protein